MHVRADTHHAHLDGRWLRRSPLPLCTGPPPTAGAPQADTLPVGTAPMVSRLAPHACDGWQRPRHAGRPRWTGSWVGWRDARGGPDSER
eukprot:34113-Eustigmatos_ZCMA.PRE.1